MAIYYGTTKVKPSGFTKAYYGNTLVYQESAPVTYTGLYFKTPDTGTIGYTKNGTVNCNIQTSSNGTTWTDWDGTAITLSANKLYVRNTTNTLSSSTSNYLNFTTTGSVDAGGEIKSLLNDNNVSNYCFYNLFYQASGIKDLSQLIIPSQVAESCYEGMFNSCSYATSLPQWTPASTVANGCYKQMFYQFSYYSGFTSKFNCNYILYATNGILSCYNSMFKSCTGLLTPPQINLTSLATWCCKEMFRFCRNLNISTTQGTAFFTCPSTGYSSSNVDSMFSGTAGGITTPTAGTTYYYS